jgi:hypothetical protein
MYYVPVLNEYVVMLGYWHAARADRGGARYQFNVERYPGPLQDRRLLNFPSGASWCGFDGSGFGRASW